MVIFKTLHYTYCYIKANNGLCNKSIYPCCYYLKKV